MILIGSLVLGSDILMRLIYQKYKATERKLADERKLEIEVDKRVENFEIYSLLVRIESDFSINWSSF